jgi:hypothetical protein
MNSSRRSSLGAASLAARSFSLGRAALFSQEANMKQPSFKPDDLVSVTGPKGRLVSAIVRRVERIDDESYNVVFEDMQTADRFDYQYLYK